MSALSAEEQMSKLIEKSTKEKRNKVITGIYEYMHKNYSKREIPHITQNAVSRVFTVLENYCKILHTGKVTKPIPAGIFHSSNLALKNCSAFKMQQRITEFFENNKKIDVDRMTSMDILKNLITEAEYETALEKFSPDKSSSSSPRTPRSHHSSKENNKEVNMEDVDGGAKKKRKTRKSRKSRKSRKNKKTSKRRSKK
jgi:hypothetical protein